jgi:glycosyltransferase involved in cell wall biosynthesis
MIEAMAVGVIPIVTKAGAESDHVCDGENGFLIDLDDFDLMAQRIVELQEKDVYNRMHQNLLVYRKQLGMEKATVFCEELILTYAR